MPLDQPTALLSAIQKELRPRLKAAGFRVEGRTYRRPVSDHVIHVINLQAGRPAAPSKAVTGLVAADLAGKFTVNLGVFLPAVATLKGLPVPPKGPREYDCQVRARLGELLSPPRDAWWALEQPIAPIMAELAALLERLALPFLARYQTPEDVIARWPGDAATLHLGNDANVVVSLQLFALGRRGEAAEVLQAQYDGAAAFPQHRAWLVELAGSLDLPLSTRAV